jgi:Fe-S cluster assembly iron-binding protein IscA
LQNKDTILVCIQHAVFPFLKETCVSYRKEITNRVALALHHPVACCRAVEYKREIRQHSTCSVSFFKRNLCLLPKRALQNKDTVLVCIQHAVFPFLKETCVSYRKEITNRVALALYHPVACCRAVEYKREISNYFLVNLTVLAPRPHITSSIRLYYNQPRNRQ